ncbi:MAG: AsmA-like C-terminal domain-containing protein [Proteobacteria bacterium]|nr:AsmA-like C-terminal domain-containing protein [Pseudomonadota bacterium]
MVHLLGGLAAGFAIILVVAAWRLSSGPVSLAFLSPYIEDALNADRQAFRIRLDDTILTWAGWERTLDIRALNVRAIGPDGRLIASVPELSLSLSTRALMRGMLAPASIELFRPKLRLLRHRDGRFQIGFDIDQSASDAVFKRVLLGLLSPPDPDRTIGYLSRFTIVDADLTIEDRRLDMSWKAPATGLTLRRDAAGITGEASLVLDVDGQEAQVAVLGTYRAATGRLDLEVDFSEIVPAVFSRIAPEFQPLGAFDLPLEGTVSLRMMVNGAVESVGFDLSGGAGQLVLPGPLAQRLDVEKLELRGRYEGASKVLEIDELFVDLGAEGTLFLPAPTNHRMPLRSVRLRGRYHGEEKRLVVSALDLDLQGPTAGFSGVVDGVGGEPVIRAQGVLRNVAVDDFARYWPRAWGPDAREWSVANLSRGVVSEARATFELRADGNGGYHMESVTGGLDFNGVTVDYLAPMPKVRKTRGTAKFDKKRFDILVTRGEAMGLRLSKGTIDFTGLDQIDQFVDIDLFIDGPVKDSLRLIDYEPLRLASTVGIMPASAGGTAATRLKLHFILEHALTRDQVRVSATSKLRDFSLAGVLLGRSIRDGRLDLKVDKKGMDVTGQVKLGTIPAAFTLRRNFADTPPFRARYELKGRVTEAQRVGELGIDFAPFSADFVKGPLDATVRFTLFDDDSRRVEATLDLADVAVTYPALRWRKDAGISGTAEVLVNLEGDDIVDIPRFAVTAGDLTVNGSARFADDGTGLERVDFTQVSYGRTDMKGTLEPAPDGGWTASFHGNGFDLEPFFDDLVRGPPGRAESNDGTAPRYTLSTDLDRVWLGPDRQIRRVVGTLVQDGGRWRTVHLRGLVAASADKGFAIAIDTTDDGKRSLSIRADDAGETLRTFNFYENMVGGTLTISGTFDDALPGKPLHGQVTIKNYNVVKAPALTRLVSILALTGVVDALRGKGLSFIVLEAPFTIIDGMLKVTDAKATGLSLGYTAGGTIDLDAEVVDFEGTVVPAYVINSMLGHIPILGTLFTGGEKGGGVFAATYRMTGPMDDPEVSVNPLSVLAPGFLRNFFRIFGEGAATSELPEEKDDVPEN